MMKKSVPYCLAKIANTLFGMDFVTLSPQKGKPSIYRVLHVVGENGEMKRTVSMPGARRLMIGGQLLRDAQDAGGTERLYDLVPYAPTFDKK